MIQENKELLLKDLCARLPYRVICEVNGYSYELVDIDIKKELIYLLKDNCYTPWSILHGDDVKPYLRPMSSMTEEECKELGDLPATIENVGETLPNIPYYIEVARPEQLDWLNAHHFDYRDLIGKGLALEAPEGMYNLNKE